MAPQHHPSGNDCGERGLRSREEFDDIHPDVYVIDLTCPWEKRDGSPETRHFWPEQTCRTRSDASRVEEHKMHGGVAGDADSWRVFRSITDPVTRPQSRC